MQASRLVARAFSIALAAVITVGMLGGIDALSQPDAHAAQWAQHGDRAQA
jgi:hypothetical protein